MIDLKIKQYQDSLIEDQKQVIASLHSSLLISDSLASSYNLMNKTSRDQISLLLLSQNKDLQLLTITKKELRRQKRLKVLGFIAAPVLVVLTLIVVR